MSKAPKINSKNTFPLLYFLVALLVLVLLLLFLQKELVLDTRLWLVLILILLTVISALWYQIQGTKEAESNLRLTKANTEKKKLNEENQQLEQELFEMKQRMESLEKSSLLIRLDLSGIILSANQAFLEQCNYTEGNIVGSRLSDLISPIHTSIFLNELQLKLQNQEVWDGEVEIINPKGLNFWMDLNLIPVKSSDSQVDFLGLFVNTSKTKNILSENNSRLHALQSGEEAERKRISTELHDGLGQMLTALKLNMDALSKEKEVSTEKLADIKNLVVQTIQECRRISNNLSPISIENYGLLNSLKQLVNEMDCQLPMKLSFSSNCQEVKLSKPAEIGVYRTLQEAINNSLKYAQASQVKIEVSDSENNYHFYVKDNGKGFDFSTKIKGTNLGNGLLNMEKRAELLDGKIFINSSEKKGTQIHLIVPKN